MAEIAAALDDARDIDGVESVSDPFDQMQPYISEDLSTAVATVSVHKSADPEVATKHVIEVAKSLRDAGLTAEVGNSLGDGVPEILGPSEIVGAALAFLVLLITFGSLVAAGAEHVQCAHRRWRGHPRRSPSFSITPIGSLTPIPAVVLGLAVGIDYTLSILARFRTELREGRGAHSTIGTAVGTAGSAGCHRHHRPRWTHGRQQHVHQ